MQAASNITDCYNKTAKSYADKFMDELSKKHFDRILLQSFAHENNSKGKLIDLGCGPGQTTKFLLDCGVTSLIGVDLSPSMIQVAQQHHPTILFETGDILHLNYPDQCFGSAIAFYAIVHFSHEQLLTAFKEIKRVLIPGAQFLFSFHIGNEVVHLNSLLDHEVDIDFHFFEVNSVTGLLNQTGFEIIDVMERHPYPNVEYASKRAYVWVKTIT